ncbi:MAG: hypothetical protein BGO49_08560 [Planctomycetales bacterium 71-10]|nr:MAG: hypothetical protein BGO49_08560 [Planctomycetales bacterium 71-10]
MRALPAAELAEWIAYDRVEGLPDLNAYQAHVCQAVIGAMGGKRVRLEDLMLRPATAAAKRLTPEETVGMLGRALGRGGEARPPAEGRTSP